MPKKPQDNDNEITKIARRNGNHQLARQTQQRKPKPRRKFRWLRLVFLLLLTILMVGLGTGIGFVAGIVKETPSLSQIGAPKVSLTSLVYDSNNKVIAELHREQHRIPVKLTSIPDYVQNAFVAIEDARYWERVGPDLRAIARAAYVNLITGSIKEGASTITQQLVKNAFTGPERTLKRKIQELILAIQMERKYTKQEILEMYLNEIYFGRNAYGIEVASQTYFGKSASQLTLPEAAVLAAMVKAPNQYSPYTNYEELKARQELVLDKMAELGFIKSEEELQKAKRAPLKFMPPQDSNPKTSSYFVDYVLWELLEKRGMDPNVVFEGGLKIYTTVDSKIQEIAEKAISEVLDPVYPLSKGIVPQAAAVVLDPKTGHIKAIVGGRNKQGQRELNRAFQSRRQPGSAFKPIVSYAPAIALGFTAASIIDDTPRQWPTNYDNKYRGLTTLREGLQYSINVMAVELLQRIGVERGLQFAQRMGISASNSINGPGSLVLEGPTSDRGPAIALGGLTKGVTPLELTSAYATFANEGVWVEPIAVTKVLDRYGNVLFEAEPQKRVVLREETAYIMTDMLKSVIQAGTGTAARLPDRLAAGKTGTTTKNFDAWFIGYTPELVTGVWMGYDKERDLGNVYGGGYPAKIWAKIMSRALQGKPATWFKKPANIVEVKVCTESGELPGPLCPPETIKTEIFAKGTEPKQQCTIHVQATVCVESKALATPYCPQVETRTFIKRATPSVPFIDEKGRELLPLDAKDEVPTQYCQIHTSPVVEEQPLETNNTPPASKTQQNTSQGHSIPPAWLRQ